MGPETLWLVSTRLHAAGIPVLPWLLKLTIFVLFKSVLPFECRLQSKVKLLHRGVGVVVHPNTRFGTGVTISHGVTIAAGGQELVPELELSIEDRVFIGAGAIVLAGVGEGLTLGAGSKIGAGAIVTQSVPAHATAVGTKARIISGRD